MSKDSEPLDYIIISDEAIEAMDEAHAKHDADIKAAMDEEADAWKYAEMEPCSQCGRLTGGCCTVPRRNEPYPTDILLGNEELEKAILLLRNSIK